MWTKLDIFIFIETITTSTELFGYLRASTISPKQAAAHQEMFFYYCEKEMATF
jgi:hypothetical protein